jgi:hypothetical protein
LAITQIWGAPRKSATGKFGAPQSNWTTTPDNKCFGKAEVCAMMLAFVGIGRRQASGTDFLGSRVRRDRKARTSTCVPDVIDPPTSSLGWQNGVGPKWRRKGLKRLNPAMGMGASVAALGERSRCGQRPLLQVAPQGLKSCRNRHSSH